MGAKNLVGIGLSYQPASLCSLATRFQTRFLESIPRPIAGHKFSILFFTLVRRRRIKGNPRSCPLRQIWLQPPPPLPSVVSSNRRESTSPSWRRKCKREAADPPKGPWSTSNEHGILWILLLLRTHNFIHVLCNILMINIYTHKQDYAATSAVYICST